jgi:hypothetical protein
MLQSLLHPFLQEQAHQNSFVPPEDIFLFTGYSLSTTLRSVVLSETSLHHRRHSLRRLHSSQHLQHFQRRISDLLQSFKILEGASQIVNHLPVHQFAQLRDQIHLKSLARSTAMTDMISLPETSNTTGTTHSTIGCINSAITQPKEMSTADKTMNKITVEVSEMTLKDPLAIETEALTEFALFKEFPHELRLNVWDYIMPEVRILEVLWDEDKGFYMDYFNRIPGILHVNVESRLHALKKLRLVEVENILENTRARPAASWVNLPSAIRRELSLGFYIDPAKDTLYLFEGNDRDLYSSMNKNIVRFLRSLKDEVAESLQNLAVGFHCLPSVLNNRIEDNENTPPLFSRFLQLKSIDMVLSDICLCTHHGFWAPRREPLAMQVLNADPMSFNMWDPIFDKVETQRVSQQFQDNVPERKSELKQGMIKSGMDEELVRNLQLSVTEVVRGESPWDEPQTKTLPSRDT